MSSNYHNPISKSAAWFALEVVLSLIGLNTLADYSEFLFTKDVLLDNSAIAVELSVADFCIEHPLCSL